jgi:hypothetical protein
MGSSLARLEAIKSLKYVKSIRGKQAGTSLMKEMGRRLKFVENKSVYVCI